MQGAFETGVYPNRFAAFGHGEAQVRQRLDEVFQQMFYGPEDVRLYHPAGEDMGYLEDTGNHDVRTEGMSYGMMFCVQLDRRAEFDRLWRWALTHMYMTEGENAGYFAWSCRPDGQKNAWGPAPDGEEYFAMALFFAAHRWGNGAGHTGYLAGQSAYYLLKAAAWEQRCAGAAHKDWVALAGAVIARLNAAKNSDGEYPFILSEETGAGLEYDALGSAWCLAAAALYAQLTGDRSGLAEMERTEAHYYNAFIARAECYSGPLDTDKAVDSEGVLAYIRAVRRLHALTGRTVYLDHLQDALGLRQHSGRFDRPVLGRTLTPTRACTAAAIPV